MLFKYHNIYNTKYFMYQYNENCFRIVKQKFCRPRGFELIEKIKEKDKEIDKENSQRCSLSRSKRFIREISLCNSFEHFVTFTVNQDMCNRYDVDMCQENLRRLLKNYQEQAKRRKKDFKYIFITEKHHDGAFHFHGLIKGCFDLYINNQGYYSSKYFDKNLGFNSFSEIKDYTKCCNYITKYITKDCVKNKKNQIYFCSKGLRKADKYEILPLSDDIFTYENDFCCIKDVDLTKEKKEVICTILSEVVDK